MSDPTPQIPGLPALESAAAVTSSSHNAWAEAEQLSRGATTEELERDAVAREHSRNQRFRNHFENLAILALWLASFAILLVGVIWLWHLVMPLGCRWLTIEDVSHLQSIVTAGLLVGVIGNHFKKRLG